MRWNGGYVRRLKGVRCKVRAKGIGSKMSNVALSVAKSDAAAKEAARIMGARDSRRQNW